MSAVAAVPAPIPVHVDPARVFDYDYFADPTYARGVPEAVADLQRDAPEVFWSPRLGGYWVVQGYEACVDAARRTDIFSSSYMRIPRAAPSPNPPAVPLNFDPPVHTKYRLPLMEVFSPKAMLAWKGRIRELAIELIDEVAPKGGCDFFQAVAEPLPVLIFMEIMGLDKARYREFRDMVHVMTSVPDEAPRSQAMRDASVMMRAVIADHRATPRDDLVSRLIDLKIDGEPISDDVLQGYCVLLFAAGLDTVANAMGFIVRRLAREPALQARLREAPVELLPKAVEELLRRHAVAPVARVVTEDVDWRGVHLARDELMLIHYPSAGLDEAKYAGAEAVDLERQMRFTAPTFGAGPHRCVGRHLARIEIEVLLEELLARLPEFRPDPERPERMHGGYVLGVDELPLVWGAGT
jgi:cytochrome P450